MTAASSNLMSAAVQHAAHCALLAPSIHDTKPWRIRLGHRMLEIQLDRSRQLHAVDPAGRQLMISCGCAAFNARVGLAAQGWRSRVARFPDIGVPDLAYRIEMVGTQQGWLPLAELASSVAERHTERRPAARAPLPLAVIDELVAAAEYEGVRLLPIHDPTDRLAVASIARRADAIENASPAGWPTRDVSARGAGWFPALSPWHRQQSVLLLGTDHNDRSEWLRVGEALERILLTLSRYGYVASPMNQPVEIRRTHDELRLRLELAWHPQVLLRAGRPPGASTVSRRAWAARSGLDHTAPRCLGGARWDPSDLATSS